MAEKPEIYNDIMSQSIENVLRDYPVKNALDIGASTGEGSTALLCHLRTFCIELDPTAFEKLKERYKDYKKVYCYNYPSSSEVMTEAEVRRLYRMNPNWDCWRTLGIFEMLEWRANTEAAVEGHYIKDGIKEIKRKHRIKNFGIVIIDGGEFTGKGELNDVWGSKIIVLDDVNGCKNFENNRRLSRSEEYKLYERSNNYRNGFSIWVKK